MFSAAQAFAEALGVGVAFWRGRGGGNGRHVLRGERHVDAAAAPPLRCPQVDLVGPCFEAAVTENILVKC